MESVPTTMTSYKELPKIILNKIELDYKEIYFTKA